MAEKFRFFHRARVRAPIAVAWDVFTDHERMGEYTNTPCEILRPGASERNGLGCLRRLGAFGWRVDEVVNIWRPHQVFGYHIVDSTEIESHQGVVRFFPTSEGCEWVYDMQNVPRAAGLDYAKAQGVSYQDLLGVGFKLYMNDIEAECERRADQERIPARPPSTSEEALFT